VTNRHRRRRPLRLSVFIMITTVFLIDFSLGGVGGDNIYVFTQVFFFSLFLSLASFLNGIVFEL